ncbi:acyl-CoA dehydrogenase [Ornithinimicrobium cryptoxanthini]|uniref:Acyl-CoA dehydrogenase n=1 Tax=Ornithinimicrobium cryptoxanthini TaxID=2934161 RepID=A0ABY4YIL7_9MICO|nr:acyl-CoA dehydrogenase [Ornithinimicrobium cryptoxanthini]USQ76529.1 acyl-CoA dehydrogenase [Ornithinimicrobium cryptoxanthini]
MSHYKSNLRDLEFNLFEVLRRQDILGQGAFGDFDEETARDILAQVSTLAENELGESLLESDRTPPTFDPETGEVTMSEAFVKSFLAWRDAEWWRMEVSEELGGTRAPASLTWAVSEMALGANPAVKMFSAGYTFAEVLRTLGNEAQQKLALQMIDNHWGATMVLTEPDAGSDVGAGRASAVQAEDGTWHITGVKRFITSGEAPFYDNVIHFVLARPEGAGPGTKGLSLFIVPKFHIGEDGELGERNGVEVANIEHKMGLKVSTTCELRFGEDESNPAVGTLLGDEHSGIAQMFHIIEYARMLVGTKAIATLSTGYLNALEYAKERVQGADMTQMTDKSAPRVTITHHPDVRRSLMLQKSYAEGLRALMLFTAAQQDTVMIAGDNPTEESQLAEKVNDLLLPLVKGCGSERAWVLLGTESLQTFGGSGFLQDYPIEQYVRDAKIDSLYEGTTAIQGQDFFFRKIVRDQGQALGHVAAQMMELVKGGGADDFLATERGLLGRALEDIQGMVEFLVGRVMASDARSGGSAEAIYAVGLSTTRFLLAAGDVVISWLLLRQAEVAQAALDAGATGADQDFYLGKVAAARFFARDVLPRVHSDRGIITHVDDSIMELPEAAF